MSSASAAPNRSSGPVSALAVVETASVALLAAYAAALVVALGSGAWLVTHRGAPGRFDFAEFWSAGRMAALGHGARAYDWKALAGLLRAQGTRAFDTTGFPFYYPPPLLLVLAPLGRLSYAAAAAVWFFGGVAAWTALARGLCRERAMVLAVIASPPVFICLVAGQTGLFVAVVAGAALLLASKHPVAAGLLLATLALKPQIALLFPLAFLAAGRWRALVVCAVAFAGLVVWSALAFGPDVWLDWMHALHPATGAPAPLSGLGPQKLQSVYGLLATLGVPDRIAMAGQAGCALAIAVWTVWLWRGAAPWSLKAAGLCAAALLASPYSAIYDLPITTVALGFLLAGPARRPMGRVEGAVLGAAYLMPLLFLIAPFPYGPLVSGLICGVVETRRRTERRAGGPSMIGSPVTA